MVERASRWELFLHQQHYTVSMICVDFLCSVWQNRSTFLTARKKYLLLFPEVTILSFFLKMKVKLNMRFQSICCASSPGNVFSDVNHSVSVRHIFVVTKGFTDKPTAEDGKVSGNGAKIDPADPQTSVCHVCVHVCRRCTELTEHPLALSRATGCGPRQRLL